MDIAIDPKFFAAGLKVVGTDDFERFGQAFYAAIEGSDFTPLGGTGDGGADGIFDRTLFETASHSRVLQISKEANVKSKIRKTVGRLEAFGRNPKSLTLLTSNHVQNFDSLEEELSDELNLRIRIRDGRYLESHVNHNMATRAAARSYILPAAAFLNSAGASGLISKSENLPIPTLCAFLGQEIEHRRGANSLLESVTDSLILWVLNDTDPDLGKFKTRDEILRDIEETLPASRKFVRSSFDQRLSDLSKKKSTSGRKINYHSKGNKYCLPLETRQIVARENAEDFDVKERVSDIFRNRSLDINAVLSTEALDVIVVVCHLAIEMAFEQRGLEIVKFIKDASGTFKLESINDFIVRAIDRAAQISGTDVSLVRNVSLEVLRRTFYNSEPIERTYLQKLSRTYTFLLIIKNEPQVVEFFQTMTAQFILYVGSDILVRALSEHYLDQADQLTSNMLRILAASGSTLILTEKTLDEVCGNLRKANSNFLSEYAHREPYLDAEAARHIDHILVRAYFYARKGGTGMGPTDGKITSINSPTMTRSFGREKNL